MGTTKYSEQSHVPNHDSKEKEFKLKENSGLKSLRILFLNLRFSRDPRSFPSLGFLPFGQAGGCGGFALRAHYDTLGTEGAGQGPSPSWGRRRGRVRVRVTSSGAAEDPAGS